MFVCSFFLPFRNNAESKEWILEWAARPLNALKAWILERAALWKKELFYPKVCNIHNNLTANIRWKVIWIKIQPSFTWISWADKIDQCANSLKERIINVKFTIYLPEVLFVFPNDFTVFFPFSPQTTTLQLSKYGGMSAKRGTVAVWSSFFIRRSKRPTTWENWDGNQWVNLYDGRVWSVTQRSSSFGGAVRDMPKKKLRSRLQLVLCVVEEQQKQQRPFHDAQTCKSSFNKNQW